MVELLIETVSPYIVVMPYSTWPVVATSVVKCIAAEVVPTDEAATELM